mmetsp:Transcript_66630/g.192461  ORF Transcript_66630/g.192461 Transcript_66630/m.192461 type:complete len:235 (+) Transcript_66630:1323-2027(+)
MRSLDWPFWISDTKTLNGFAWPRPNLSNGMLWSDKIFATVWWSTSSFLEVADIGRTLKNGSWSSSAFSGDHHEYLIARWCSPSSTAKVCESICFHVHPTMCSCGSCSCCFKFGFPAWARVRRSTNSRRLSLTPAFAPVSFKSESTTFVFSSGWLAPPKSAMSAMKGWFTACLASIRVSSLRSNAAFTSSTPGLSTRLEITSFFVFTSSWFLNGNLALNRPNMTTPTAQQSTFKP